MRAQSPVAAIACAVAVSGCTAFTETARREEARQLAWTGPGAGPCMFGGVTERAVAHCARINFGTEGLLQAVNEKVLHRFGAGSCTRHATELSRELARHDLRTEPVYTCPERARARGVCHVSLLVTMGDGSRYVLDNGVVVRDTVGAGGVAEFAEFSSAVDGVMWVGIPPTSADIARAFGQAAPSATHARAAAPQRPPRH